MDRTCFQHDIDIFKICLKTASDKVLRDKAFGITKNPKYD